MSDYRSYPSPQQTPQRGRPSTPSKLLSLPAIRTPQASPSVSQTPCKKKGLHVMSTGLPTPQISPFPKYGDGTPVKLYTPKAYAEMAQQRSASATRSRVASATGSPTKPRLPSTMGPPTQRRVASATETPTRPNMSDDFPPTLKFGSPKSPRVSYENLPPRLRRRSASPTKAPARSPSAPVDLVALRRERREPGPPRRTVQLMSIITKCWDDDTQEYSRWTIVDNLLRGGCEERDTTGIWKNLRYVVGELWPNLEEWIMLQVPTEKDSSWFSCTGSSSYAREDYAHGPQIDREGSPQERLGLSMSADAFDVARAVVRELADRRHSFDCLLNDDFNPFFMIYAFADCNVPLPTYFSRQLFWKHLDAIVRLHRWRGFEYSRSDGATTRTRRQPPTMRVFSRKDDPEDIVGQLLTLKQTGRLPNAVKMPEHEFLLIIAGTRWVASTPSLGKFSYAADELRTEEVAPFAVLDALTRWLPHWRNCTLRLRTNDVYVMWGVHEQARSGPWCAVHGLCAQYGIVLRTAMAENRFEYPRNGSYSHSQSVPLRNPDVVDAALKELAVPGPERDSGYRAMVRHHML